LRALIGFEITNARHQVNGIAATGFRQRLPAGVSYLAAKVPFADREGVGSLDLIGLIGERGHRCGHEHGSARYCREDPKWAHDELILSELYRKLTQRS